MEKVHSFHIPVMGIGFTIDTPLKVAQYGIDSVISLNDDLLFEKLRKYYYEKYNIPYTEISEKIEDFRAKRITAYLNLMNDLVEKKFKELKNLTAQKEDELKKYIAMLPNSSAIKNEFKELTTKYINIKDISNRLKNGLTSGSIDVNIMTKVNKTNYANGEPLPLKYNDAHAALRGYANSNLTSSLVLSAGMNPKLYSYIEEFDAFYPDENGDIQKKIILKVSDYRSAFIQGKFLAKKGIWVSEYRIESGLNCGGHAFATNGFLLGVILEEFKEKREHLTKEIEAITLTALAKKNRTIPKRPLSLKITAQGGVGTAEEHQFLLEYYKLDSVGWGSPFLLVPEATTVDNPTRKQLESAQEEDLYLSNISPLGVPFNNLKGSSKELEKEMFIQKGRPGSSCPKKFLTSNKEFTNKDICTASRQYQHLKIKELETMQLSADQYQKEFDKITEKTCICTGLGTSALIEKELSTKVEGSGVSICPGPNMAYFSKTISLKEMVDHIYGRTNIMIRQDRPNMFLKELGLYLSYLKDRIEETTMPLTKKQNKYLTAFAKNLADGIDYYSDLFQSKMDRLEPIKNTLLEELSLSKKTLESLHRSIERLKSNV